MNKKRVGRPAGRKYTRDLPVYVTPDEAALAKALARARGLTVAAFFRHLLNEEAIRTQRREQFEAALDAMTPEDWEEDTRAHRQEDPTELVRPELRG